MAIRISVNDINVLTGRNVLGIGNRFNLVVDTATNALVTWGDNDLGQLGRPGGTFSAQPLPAGGFASDTSVSVAGGRDHSVLLNDKGEVYEWGRNDEGQLGISQISRTANPQPATLSITNVVAIAAGFGHTMAQLSNGHVSSWGSNEFGQLGDGTTQERDTAGTTLVQVVADQQPLGDVIAIAAGYYHNLALESDGTVWTWGRNDMGQLGDGTQDDRHGAVQVRGPGGALANVVAIGSGMYHSLAVKSDGTVWTWGDNQHGQLGDGTKIMALQAVQVVRVGGLPLDGITAVAAGEYHSLALDHDGCLWAWGRNNHGQLGTGDTVSSRFAVPVQYLDGQLDHVLAVGAGRWHSVVVVGPDQDGSNRLLAWGANDLGQIGHDASNTAQTTPTEVSGVKPATPVTGGQYDFGEVAAGSQGEPVAFRLDNLNDSTLTLVGGDDALTIDGPDKDAFVIVKRPATPVDGKGNSTFEIRFKPGTEDRKRARLWLRSDDDTQPTYSIALIGTATPADVDEEPEIDVGRSYPLTGASYDFGTWTVGDKSQAESFVIHNLGGGVLQLTGESIIALTGADADQFVLEPDPDRSASIGAHASSTFALRFAPTSEGDKVATVRIDSNDADEPSYTFTITGRAVADSGDSGDLGLSVQQPVDSQGHDFGAQLVGTAGDEVTFLLHNPGPGPLTLTGDPRVTITGLAAGDFTVTHQPRSVILAGRSASFTVVFKPVVKGLREALVEIPHDRGGRFTAPVRGTGTTEQPDIEVTDSDEALVVVDYHYSFAEGDIGARSQGVQFFIHNRGAGNLALSHEPTVYCHGGDSSSFIIADEPASPIKPGDVGTFTAYFEPQAPAGDKRTTVSIASNDPDTPDYHFELLGRARQGIRPSVKRGRLSIQSLSMVAAVGPDGSVSLCPIWEDDPPLLSNYYNYGAPTWTENSDIDGFEAVASSRYRTVSDVRGSSHVSSWAALALRDGVLYGARYKLSYYERRFTGDYSFDSWVKNPIAGDIGPVKVLCSFALLGTDGRVFELSSNWHSEPWIAPVAVPDAPGGLIALAGGPASNRGLYGLCADGSVWAVGDNRFGQLGRGSTGQVSPVWKQVRDQNMQPLQDIVAIVSQRNTAAAVRADGTVWTWGSSEEGQLGRTGSNALAGQVPIPGGLKIRDVAIGGLAAAVTTKDTLVIWGNWQVKGDPFSYVSHFDPTERPEFGEIIGVAGGDYHSMAVVDKSGRVGLLGHIYFQHVGVHHYEPYWLPGALLGD